MVSLSECVLPLMLCGRTTADMVGFTGRTLLSLYPKLTVQRLALLSGRSVRSSAEVLADITSKLADVGVNLLPSNKDWMRPCGCECPSLTRSITENLGLFHVSDEATDRVIEQWDVSEAQWSLGWNCSNSLCHRCLD